MEVRYKNTLEDYVDFNLYLYENNRWIKFVNNIAFYVYQIVLLILVIVSLALDMTIIEKIILLFCIIVIWGIWISLYHKSQKRRIIKKVKKLIKKDPFLLSEKILTLGTDRISIKSEKENIDILFDTFDRIIDNEKYILIIDKENKPIVIISSDFFKNEEVRGNFFNYIKTHCQ